MAGKQQGTIAIKKEQPHTGEHKGSRAMGQVRGSAEVSDRWRPGTRRSWKHKWPQ
jgi:hypothetical protein